MCFIASAQWIPLSHLLSVTPADLLVAIIFGFDQHLPEYWQSLLPK